MLAGGALVGSISRTSMLATIVAVVFLYRDVIFQRKFRLPLVGLGLVGVTGLILLLGTTDVEQWIMSKIPFFSKSGDSEELFSATGRSEIWAYTIQLIGERPLTGYGAATSKYFLSEYSLYTHNLILHIAFSTGVVGGLAAVWMCLGRAIALFTDPHPIADALVAFVLINGLFENVIFAILAGLPTMIWTIALCLPLLPDDSQYAPSVPSGALDVPSASTGRIR
jgi:O-antigen ligase